MELSAEAIAMYDFSMDDIRLADLNQGIPDFGIEFDIIMASMVLHWLSEPHKFLRQAKDMLSPAGIRFRRNRNGDT